MFTVIIPTYNKAHTIEITIKSILNQTYQNFEIVIVNDGSTDNSDELIIPYLSDNRIKLFNQDNHGVSSARNKGISEATYSWVAFLDGDDEWESSYLEKVYQTINTFPETEMILMGRYGQNVQTGQRNNCVPEKYRDKIQNIDFFHNPHVFAHISATTIKKDVLKNNINTWGSFVIGQKSNEDFTFLFRVALHVQVAYCGYPLAIYNGGVVGQATSTLLESKKLADSILFHNLVLQEWINTEKINKSFIRFMKYEIRHNLLGCIKSNNYPQLNQFLQLIDRNYFDHLNRLDSFLTKNKSLRFLAIVYLYLTKLQWRSYGYPIVK